MTTQIRRTSRGRRTSRNPSTPRSTSWPLWNDQEKLAPTITKEEVLAQVPGKLSHRSKEAIARRVIGARLGLPSVNRTAIVDYHVLRNVLRFLDALKKEKLVVDYQGERREGWSLLDDWMADRIAAEKVREEEAAARRERKRLEEKLKEQAAKRALAYLKLLGITAEVADADYDDHRIVMDPTDVEWMCEQIESARK